MVIGAAGTCLGAWLKVFSAEPGRFLITLLGQGLVACSQAFILSLPSRLAAVWFGSTEVSTACSLGVFGNQVRSITSIHYIIWLRMYKLSKDHQLKVKQNTENSKVTNII